MKIIFNSKEELEKFREAGCPSNISLENACEIDKCDACWKEALIKVSTIEATEE